MARPMRRPWAVAVVPVLLGAVVTLAMAAAGEDRIIHSTLKLSWLAFVIGAVLTLGIAVTLLVQRAGRQRVETALEHARTGHREDHRRFLSRLDHELKNPLTAIRVGLANLESGSFEAAARGIDTQTQRLSRLLGDLRKLSGVQSMPLERAQVDIAGVVEEALEVVQDLPAARERVFGLSFPQAPRPLPLVSGDTDLLFLAVYNLISNAVKYSASGDRIEVRGYEGHGVVVLEVADTGRGMPEDELETVWEELARGTQATDMPGSGLGLPFVRAIVERHHGSVELRSRLGEGTVVEIRLPLPELTSRT